MYDLPPHLVSSYCLACICDRYRQTRNREEISLRAAQDYAKFYRDFYQPADYTLLQRLIQRQEEAAAIERKNQQSAAEARSWEVVERKKAKGQKKKRIRAKGMMP